MYSVYQHWDPLRVCVVGRSYPPEFYSWIEVPHVRNLFERIATETEEDYQNIIKKLQSFGVEVLRPNCTTTEIKPGQPLRPPPMCPRDHMVMIGNDFYCGFSSLVETYKDAKDPNWPTISNWQDFYQLPGWIQKECRELHKISEENYIEDYSEIVQHVKKQGNNIIHNLNKPELYSFVNGAMVSRIGRDLYFGTECYEQNQEILQKSVDSVFIKTRNHIVNTGGHSDSTYCPVAPGLIISLRDIPTYADTFPGWEVVYLPDQSWQAIKPFMDLKRKNGGKWWIPGFEYDNDVINVVETWLNHWTGYVEETVFDVNMLIVDPKNVIVFNHNDRVFDALDRYGITPHVVPFRHRYFWDGGIHCVTADLHREGQMQDYFPNRK